MDIDLTVIKRVIIIYGGGVITIMTGIATVDRGVVTFVGEKGGGLVILVPQRGGVCNVLRPSSSFPPPHVNNEHSLMVIQKAGKPFSLLFYH